MQALQCIIIDDEPSAITTLAYEIQRIDHPSTTLIASFTKAQDAINYLSSPSGSDVDAIFLDIEMPEMDGFSFLNAIEKRSFQVVFITAHSHYAIEAIRKQAFDYLVKPILQQELKATLERLANRITKNTIDDNTIFRKKPPLLENEQRIRIETDRKVVFLKPDDIIYCESDGNYCYIYLEHDKRLFLTQPLKTLSATLPTHQFMRTHKSYIVNLLKIKEYHRVEHFLLLSNGKQIPVSRQLWRFFSNR